MPQPADVHVDRAAVGGEVTLPHPLYQVGAAEHRRRVRAKECQQLEFLECERDLRAVHPDPSLLVVEQQSERASAVSAELGAPGAPGAAPGAATG